MKLKAAPKPDQIGDPQGIVFDPEMLQEEGPIVMWCKDLACILESAYPGWLWGIGPDPRGRIITISSFRLSNEFAYVINMEQTPIEDAGVRRRVALQAGGEVLERFDQKRGPYDPERYLASPRALTGLPRMDLSDKDRTIRRFAQNQEIDTALRTGAMDMKVIDKATPSGLKRNILIRPGENYGKASR